MWYAYKSKIHGTGIFASQNIKKGQKIIQYVGEKITKAEGDKRSALRIKNYLNSSNFILFAAFNSAIPPPGTIPSFKAALTA